MQSLTNEIKRLILQSENELNGDYLAIDKIALHNQDKVLSAFIRQRIALRHFSGTTGYGYDDQGRDALARVFSDVFKSQSAIVSPHILSGTHAITLAIFSLLKYGDNFLSVTGKPYETLNRALAGNGNGSLAHYGINYNQIDLTEDGDFAYELISDSVLQLRPRMVFIQRSRGYTLRNPVSINQIRSVCEFIRNIIPETIILIDNCYGEFTENSEPIEVGADVICGSLIKNPGGGIAPNGAYIAGKESFIEKISDRFTVPFLGREIGSNFGGYQYFYQGLFVAPHVTAQSLKGALLMGAVMSKLGYRVMPQKIGDCYDIIRAIEFNSSDEMIAFCQTIQEVSPVDSYVTPLPWDMPGYDEKVIMAAGCFVQGSSIELSADGPIRKPYTAYCQGGLTYEHVKIAVSHCAEKLLKMRN